jgi:hypothetical protein
MFLHYTNDNNLFGANRYLVGRIVIKMGRIVMGRIETGANRYITGGRPQVITLRIIQISGFMDSFWNNLVLYAQMNGN